MPEPRSPRFCIVVSPFYPPSALPPSHRARLFVRHLPAFGWTPIVITVDPRDREDRPEAALVSTVPAGIRTEFVRAVPAKLTRPFGVGDLALRGLLSLAWRTVHVARRTPGAVVLLIVPPWYALWLVPIIARAGRTPVVVDYVDPWRIQRAGTVKSALATWLAARTEALALHDVSGLFGVAEPIVAEAQARRAHLPSVPTGAAPYGFEPADWALAGELPASTTGGRRSGTVRIVYIGAVSDGQLPVLAAVLDALAHIRDQQVIPPDGLRLELFGTTYANAARAVPRASALIQQRGLGDWVTERPPRVAYGQALKMMLDADANLVLGDMTGYYAASKLIPVLSARRPVLAVLQAETEPARLLGRLDCRGLVCYGATDRPSPSAAVSAIVQTLLDLYHNRIPIVSCDFAGDPVLAGRTAEHMTGELARVLDRVDAAHRDAA